jgi:hypothetical protein
MPKVRVRRRAHPPPAQRSKLWSAVPMRDHDDIVGLFSDTAHD